MSIFSDNSFLVFLWCPADRVGVTHTVFKYLTHSQWGYLFLLSDNLSKSMSQKKKKINVSLGNQSIVLSGRIPLTVAVSYLVLTWKWCSLMDCSSQMCLPAFEEREKGRKIHICVACLTILITDQENSKWFNILHDLLTSFYERLSYNLGNECTIFLSLSCLKNLELFCLYGYKTYVNLSLSWTTWIQKTSVTYVSVCARHHTRCRRSWHNVPKFR